MKYLVLWLSDCDAGFARFGMSTYHLSISSKSIETQGGCEAVAQWLAANSVEADVTRNWSTTGDNNQVVEGCRIVMGSDEKNIRELWPQLKQTFDLQCAHLREEKFFSGCIHDYFKVSTCREQKDAKEQETFSDEQLS